MKTTTLYFQTAKEFQAYLASVNLMPTQQNRIIIEAHVNEMYESIKDFGVQRAIILIETKCYDGKKGIYVADGQHLRKAILNFPTSKLKGMFAVTINKIDNEADIINFVSSLNSTAKNWSLSDYLNAFVSIGNKNYIFLRDLQLNTKIRLNGLIEAYSTTVSKGNIDFKNGNFVADKKVGNELLETYDNAVSIGLHRSSSSFLAWVRFLRDNPTIEKKKVINGISKQSKKFSFSHNRDGFITLLCSLFGTKK